MTTLLMKPVHWNPTGYLKPAGHKATGGYPAECGFGHEEWNNSPGMRFWRAGIFQRSFHTEPVGNSARYSPGDTIVFMYASHDGRQELVGIAGKSTDLTELAEDRKDVRKLVGMSERRNDAWEQLRVRRAFDDDRAAFEKRWMAEEQYTPRWVCPDDHYLWLDTPIVLDAMAIRAAPKYLTMYSSYTNIELLEAEKIMNLIPPGQRNSVWHRLMGLMGGSAAELKHDLAAIIADTKLSVTTREALIDARCGQGRFRSDVLRRWNMACAVTGCRVLEAIRASHILPWRESTNRKRLDGANGLSLIASIDALFDRGLISFEDDGTMLVSSVIGSCDRALLGIPAPLSRAPDAMERAYLQQHRAKFERRFHC